MGKPNRYDGNKFSKYYLDLSDTSFEFQIHEKNNPRQSRMRLKEWEYNHIINQNNTNRDEYARDRAIQLVFWSVVRLNDERRRSLMNSSTRASALYDKKFQARLN